MLELKLCSAAAAAAVAWIWENNVQDAFRQVSKQHGGPTHRLTQGPRRAGSDAPHRGQRMHGGGSAARPQRSCLFTFSCWGAEDEGGWVATPLPESVTPPQTQGPGTGVSAATVKMHDERGNETLWGKFCFIIYGPAF